MKTGSLLFFFPEGLSFISPVAVELKVLLRGVVRAAPEEEGEEGASGEVSEKEKGWALVEEGEASEVAPMETVPEVNSLGRFSVFIVREGWKKLFGQKLK